MGLTQLTFDTDGLEVKDKPLDESKSQATASWASAVNTAQLEWDGCELKFPCRSNGMLMSCHNFVFALHCWYKLHDLYLRPSLSTHLYSHDSCTETEYIEAFMWLNNHEASFGLGRLPGELTDPCLIHMSSKGWGSLMSFGKELLAEASHALTDPAYGVPEGRHSPCQ